MLDDNFKALCMAIIEQAVKDYKVAYKTKNHSEVRHLEKFFYSDTFEMMVDDRIDAERLLKQIREDIDGDGVIRVINKRREPYGKHKPK